MSDFCQDMDMGHMGHGLVLVFITEYLSLSEYLGFIFNSEYLNLTIQWL